MTPFTCEGRMRLNDSHEIPPNASGETNSVASTSPKRSTTVSQMIEERIQWRAAPSGNGNACPKRLRSVVGVSTTDVANVSVMRRGTYELAPRGADEMTKLS